MPKELERWGGELRMPGWLRWLLRRGPAPDDTDERAHERRNPEATVDTPLVAMDRAILGPFSESFPDERARRR
jgi:hypothetical protein